MSGLPAALNRLLAAHNDLDEPFMRRVDANPLGSGPADRLRAVRLAFLGLR
jgi:hypothetical protein